MAPEDLSGKPSLDEKEGRREGSATNSSSSNNSNHVASKDEAHDVLPEAATDDNASESSTEAGEVQEETLAHRVLSHVLERLSTRASSVAPEPPPDGGWRAWTIAFASHLVVMNTWGFINSFGIFQTYYSETLHLPPSKISWIGSVQVFLLFLIGTITGRLTDAGYFRPVFALGSLLQLLGIFTASLPSTATSYPRLLAAQGVCMGLANGFLFCPCLALLATYFHRRRSLAIGLAASGSATGGIVFPALARRLLPRAGLPWTLRSVGLVQLLSLLACNLLLRPRVAPRPRAPLLDLAAFADPAYAYYALASFFLFEGVYFPFYYLPSLATAASPAAQISPPMPYPASLDLLLLLNAVGAPGRILPNHLADRVGVVNVLVPTALVSAVLVYAWAAVRTPAGLWVWTAFFGLAGGAIQGLFPAGLSSLTADPRKQGTRIGMVFTIVSFAVLTGPPIAGAIIQAQGGRYVGAQIFAGSCLLVGMGFMIAARLSRSRKTEDGWRHKV